MKKLRIVWLALTLAILGSTGLFAQDQDHDDDPNHNSPNQCGQNSTLAYNQIVRASQRRAEGDLSPIVRIVSPTAGSFAARGESRIGAGSPNGTAFAFNVEVITRDAVPVVVREATLAPPVFGIRHVERLGCPNPDAPGFYAFVDQDFVTPNGTIIPRNTNLASLFNVAGTDDTPGPGVTVWLGWHVLESFLPRVRNFKLTVAFVDRAGRIGFDELKNIRISNRTNERHFGTSSDARD